MTIAAETSTWPDAGVIATRPATAPAEAPSTLGAPLCSQETVIQVRAAIAAAVVVTTNALAARPPEESALPAVNPNHPNQSSDAPSPVMGASWRSVAAVPTPPPRPRLSGTSNG